MAIATNFNHILKIAEGQSNMQSFANMKFKNRTEN